MRQDKTLPTVTDRSGCPASRHGTESVYRTHGCRCLDAREMKRQRDKRRRLGRQQPLYVANVGTARRLEALAAIGWTFDALAVKLGIAAANVAEFRRRARVHHTTAQRVDDVYRELRYTPGPSSLGRTRAIARGWASPLAWDNIDDPRERPASNEAGPTDDDADLDVVMVLHAVAGRRRFDELTSEEADEVVRRAMARGLTPIDAARQLGWDEHTLRRVWDRTRRANARREAAA